MSLFIFPLSWTPQSPALQPGPHCAAVTASTGPGSEGRAGPALAISGLCGASCAVGSRVPTALRSALAAVWCRFSCRVTFACNILHLPLGGAVLAQVWGHGCLPRSGLHLLLCWLLWKIDSDVAEIFLFLRQFEIIGCAFCSVFFFFQTDDHRSLKSSKTSTLNPQRD